MKSKSTSLLFEIGTEEIPSGYFAPAAASILAKAGTLLADCGWKCERLDVSTTPRRIVIHAEGFEPFERPEEEKLGPMKEQAYQDGKPTQALIGFLKSAGRSESDVTLKPTPKGERVSVKIKKESKPLRHFFETLPRQIEFPKLMRWESSRYLFPRPIRWTFAFVGNKKQNYTLADVRSGDFTFGHRFLSPGKMKVRSADLDAYRKSLALRHVILDTEARIRKIRSFLKPARNEDPELVNAVARLVEDPFPICGKFGREYLKLPEPVLTTCMSKHQRIFSCFDARGKLQNKFAAVINGRRTHTREIAKHYESVLRSRLEDAKFFFSDDRKTKLEAKVPKLRELIFLGSLGSYWDKTKRVEALTEFLGKEAGLAEDVIRRAKRAAYLAKADLTTRLVYEFPELQGKAGSEYAKRDGEEEAAAEAIAGHYLPASLSEDFRGLRKRLNQEGALVGLADRMDLVTGAFGLGIKLSSSEDPYALRRAAGGIVKILRAHPFPISLSRLASEARGQFGNLISLSESELLSAMIPFFKERIVFELQVKLGTREYEVLQGIFAGGLDRFAEVYQKFGQLAPEIRNESFLKACKVMERTANILKGAKEKIADTIEPALFQDSLERELNDLVSRKEGSIRKLADEKKIAEAVRTYGDLFYQPVHDFFDRVMVNVDDSAVRSNRQALMKRINRLCADHAADLSLVTNL